MGSHFALLLEYNVGGGGSIRGQGAFRIEAFANILAPGDGERFRGRRRAVEGSGVVLEAERTRGPVAQVRRLQTCLRVWIPPR